MTTSILNDCLHLKDELLYKTMDYLHSVGISIFDPIFEMSKDETERRWIILYILCAYSEESPMVILRQDSKVEQDNICEYLQIPEFRRSEIVGLKDNTVRLATTEYVNQFATPLFRWLQFAKIQYQYFESIVTARDFLIDGKEGEKPSFDIKEMGKCIQEMRRLAKEIHDIEGQLRRERGISESLDKMREDRDKKNIKPQKGGGAIENSQLIT